MPNSARTFKVTWSFVGLSYDYHQQLTTFLGAAPLLYISNCKHHSMVAWFLLLLCYLHFPHIIRKHNNNTHWNPSSKFYFFNNLLIFTYASNPSKTMKRLREVSRFECDVRVLRNGFCKWWECHQETTHYWHFKGHICRLGNSFLETFMS